MSAAPIATTDRVSAAPAPALRVRTLRVPAPLAVPREQAPKQAPKQAPEQVPEQAPVFVDTTGHRRRWLRVAGYVAAIGCLVYAVIMATSLLWSPITPDKSQAASKAPHTSTSQTISSGSSSSSGHGQDGGQDSGQDKRAGGI
jgi:hypothetical protein